MSDLTTAILVAANAHHGQVDKAKQPYILHPLRVMLAVDSDEERIAAVLHDVVEDTEVTLEDLRTKGFPAGGRAVSGSLPRSTRNADWHREPILIAGHRSLRQTAVGRSGRIRTDDPLTPSQVRYRAALHSGPVAMYRDIAASVNPIRRLSRQTSSFQEYFSSRPGSAHLVEQALAFEQIIERFLQEVPCPPCRRMSCQSEITGVSSLPPKEKNRRLAGALARPTIWSSSGLPSLGCARLRGASACLAGSDRLDGLHVAAADGNQELVAVHRARASARP
jgi:hypothetical protein